DPGWLVTANNDVTGQTIDNDPLNDGFYYTYHFDEGFRNDRASDLLTTLDSADRNPDHMKGIQSDHVSLMAQRVRPYYLDALSNQAVLDVYSQAVQDRLAQAKGYVEGWDLRCRAGMPDPFDQEDPSPEDVQSSIASSIFFVWLNNLTSAVFDDELGQAGIGMGSADRARALVHILDDVDEPEGSPHYVNTIGAGGQSLLWDNVDTRRR
ncbi:MAG: penicillin acylase family protein, partial [Thermodesulfobacteriota bacterium]